MPRLGKKDSKFEHEFKKFLEESSTESQDAYIPSLRQNDTKLSEKPWWMRDEESTESNSLKNLGTSGKAFLKKPKSRDSKPNGIIDPLQQYSHEDHDIHPGGDEPVKRADLKLALPSSDPHSSLPVDDPDDGDPERRLRGAADPHYSQDMLATLAGYTGSGFSTIDNSSTLGSGLPEEHKANINNFTGPTTAEFATGHNTSIMDSAAPRGVDYFGTGGAETNTAGPTVRFSTVVSEIEDEDFNDEGTEPDDKQKSLGVVPPSSMLSQVSLHDSMDDTTMSRHHPERPPQVTRSESNNSDAESVPDHKRGEINFAEFEAQNQLSTGHIGGMMGETTAADISEVHAAYAALDGTGNTEAGAAGGLTTLNDPSEQYTENNYPPSSIITTQSFGIRAIRPASLDRDMEERIPSPESRHMNYSDSRSKRNTSEIPHKPKQQSKRFSNVKSSGYGRKSVSPASSQQRQQPKVDSSSRDLKKNNRSLSRSAERKSGHYEQSHRPQSGNSARGRTRPGGGPRQGHPSSTPAGSTGGTHTKWEVRSSSGVASGSRDAEDHSFASRASLVSGGDGATIRPSNAREQQLKEEIDEWREKWKEERKQCAKAKSDLMLIERQHTKEIERLACEHEQTILRLQSQISSLQNRLDEKVPLVNRKLPADISKEDIARLEKQMEEQETLLNGYQKENERLYTEIKRLQMSSKQSESHHQHDTQKLHQELSSLKLELERKDIELKSFTQRDGSSDRQFAMSGLATGNPADVAAVRYQLESDLRTVRNELDSAYKRMRDLEVAKEKAESKINQMMTEQSNNLSREERERAVNSVEIQKLKDRHQEEVNELKKKIKWYLENQAILNRDAQKLKEKDKLIAELETKLNRLQGGGEHIQISGSIRSKERSHDAVKIKRLEDEITYLNSKLSSDYPTDQKTRSKVQDYLESRVKELEKRLQDRQEDEERSLRSLEQQHLVIKAKYEDQIQILESELNNKAPEDKKRVNALQKQVEHLEDQIKQRNQTIHKLKRDLLLNKRSDQNQLGKTFPVKKNDPQDKNNNWKIELIEKDKEITNLKRQLNEALAKQYSPSSHERRSHVDMMKTFAFPEPSPDVTIENDRLKREVNDLRSQVEHYRLLSDSALTQRDYSTNQIRTEMEKKLHEDRENLVKELQRIKIDYAEKHSQSRVAELQAKVDSQELVISHLKEQLARNSVDSRALEISRAVEKEAKERIDKLTLELAEAKAYHTPQMRQFDHLKAKVIALEEKQKYKEANMEQYIEKRVGLARAEAEKEALKWRRLVEEKSQNLAVARSELDKLLETLGELQRQGVILPVKMDKLTRAQKQLGQSSTSTL